MATAAEEQRIAAALDDLPDGVDYVCLVRAEGALIDVPIQRGSAVPTDAMADGVEILSGLEPGDTIVPPEAGA